MTVTNDLGKLASGLSSTNAQTLYKRLDPLGKGSLGLGDFASLYAELADQAHQSSMGGNPANSNGLPPTTFLNFHRTIFLSDFLAVREKAIGVFTQLDTDGSGSVSKQEFMDGLNGRSTPSDATAPLAILKSVTAQSQAMLAKYDSNAKGYLIQSDLAAAYKANPSLGDVSSVPQLFAQLDLNGSGRVSAGDLNTNALLNEISKQMQGKFGTPSTNSIALSTFDSQELAQLPWSFETIKSWSSDQGKTLTASDVMNGVLNVARSERAKGAQSTQDANTDGQITLSEILATSLSSVLKTTVTQTPTTPDTPSTPATTAGQLLQQALSDAQAQIKIYDTHNQGYFTLEDVVTAWTKDPTLGDAATAPDIFKNLDLDGNGKITGSELVSGNFASNIADQFASLITAASQTNLTQNGTALPLSALQSLNQTLLPWSVDTIQAWDQDNDGALTRQEIMSGALNMAQHVMAAYDPHTTGQFKESDVQTALDKTSTTNQTAQAVIKQWDANQDGSVTFEDVMATTLFYLKGLKAEQLAAPPPSEAISAPTTLSQAQTWANNVLSLFDSDKKHYITLTDIANLYAKQPSLGDVTQAADTLNQWDLNADGRVTQDELSAFNANEQLKTQIMGWLDPQKTGSIPLASLTQNQLAALPYSSDQLKQWDNDSDGALSTSELAAGLLHDARTILSQYDAAQKGYFTQADIQTVLDANAQNNQGLTAQGVMSYWDINSDGQVGLAEILSGMNGYIADNKNNKPLTANSVYTDAQSKAQTTMAQFDPSAKGYLTAADIAAAYQANPSLGDPAQADSTIAAWDLNQDHTVTTDEVMSGILLSGWANSLLTQLDPTNQGFINTSSLSAVKITMPALPNANQAIASWDANQDGQVDQTELVTGLRQQAQALINQFDQANKGYFTLDDVQSHLTASSSTDQSMQASTIMGTWDLDHDGRVTLNEVLAGLSAGQAPPISASATAPLSS